MAGYPRFRMKQVNKHLFHEFIGAWRESTVLPKDVIERLEKEFPINVKAETLTSKQKDTIKAIMELSDGLSIETVLMRHGDGRNTVCVSSQAGCALRCAFCATGMKGFNRDLSSWEMVMQVLFFARLLKEEGERVTNVVFMGMGEPFLNYDNVLDAIRILNDKEGFDLGARNISVSTAGIVEGIDKLSKEDIRINLAVSLHSPNNEIRSKLMPINRKYPIESLMEAVARYTEKTNRQVMFEYMLLKDVNDSDKDAVDLARMMKDHLYVVNLISYNPTGSFKASPAKKVERFKEILEKRGVKVTRRHSFGADIQSACGQLSGNKKSMRELLDKLADLELPEDGYALYGSSPMAIRGIKEARELDVVVKDRLFDELSAKYGNKDPDRLALEGGDIEIFPARNSLLDEPVDVIDRAETIEGFRFVLLDDIIRWKKKMGRKKDAEHIEMIREFLERSDLKDRK